MGATADIRRNVVEAVRAQSAFNKIDMLFINAVLAMRGFFVDICMVLRCRPRNFRDRMLRVVKCSSDGECRSQGGPWRRAACLMAGHKAVNPKIQSFL